jgi:murein L,D-transpeptidase YafK
MRRIVHILVVLVGASIGFVIAREFDVTSKVVQYLAPQSAPAVTAPKRSLYTVEERVAQYGRAVDTRLAAAFSKAQVAYPPHEIAYVAFKDQRRLQVYARNSNTAPWRFVTQYAVLAASGSPGPKLAEGDMQVPEGIYKAELLNANSRFHLSIRLNYPNDFDRRMAKHDNRSRLGGDIMIHGNQVSIGCLAMGDQAAEDLFILAARVGKERTRILVSPTDFRADKAAVERQTPAWTRELYDTLRSELRHYPRPLIFS